MGAKSEALAKQFEAKVQEAVATLQKLSNADWAKVTDAEKWSVGVTAHHLAGVLEPIAGAIKAVVAGQSLNFTGKMIDTMNAQHAKDHANCTKAETIELLKKGAAVATVVVRGLGDDQLAKRGTVDPGAPPMTVEQLITGGLIAHTEEHFASIRKTVGMATQNKVGVTTFTTPSDREIVATRVFDAPRRRVWEAWTNPKHVPHWMTGPEGWTMPVCEIDLRPGGTWHFVWRGSDGTEMEMRGVYREIVPPERLVNSESWGGDWPDTLNTLVLTEEDGKTKTTCTVLYPSEKARDAALGTGMKEGWSASYDRLDEYLGTMA